MLGMIIAITVDELIIVTVRRNRRDFDGRFSEKNIISIVFRHGSRLRGYATINVNPMHSWAEAIKGSEIL
jgi:hypothetical protein